MYQMPYTYHPHPTHGSPQSPFPYETTQGVYNHTQPIPMGYHNCCNYGYVPNYYTPPYPHYPPPPPFYYPSIPPMYPIHYPSPPHYQTEQPRYEFDKNQIPGHQCCGCPDHHQSSKKDDRIVEIEQQEPEIEKIPSKSLLPVDPKSHSYPLVLVPHEYMNSREQRNEMEPKISEQNSSDSRIESNVKSLGKRNPNLMEGKTDQLPFPIFWIPYKGSEEEGKGCKEMGLLGNNGDDRTIDSKVRETRDGNDAKPVEMMKKISNPKLIPVKQVGENEKDNKETKQRLIEVKQVRENREKGESENKLSEKLNKSKLPPVCLRVEPLKKKRNGSNGNSRSPSPKRDENKSLSCSQNEKFEHKGGENNKGDEKVEVIEEINRSDKIEKIEKIEDKGSENNNGDDSNGNSRSFSCSQNKKFEHQGGENIKGDKKVEGSKGNEENEKCELETKAKKFSEIEAAIKIQSVYRGFEVRRSEQMKKLKQIGEIKEKMAEIKSRIEELENSSADNSGYEKQRVVIGEMVMSLLLKLDTIQGLHPTVREIRKSVAKELSTFQERIDSMGNKSSDLSSVELKEDKKAQLDQKSSIEASQAIVSEVVEKEKAMDEPLSSVCECKGNLEDEIKSEMGVESGDFPTVEEERESGEVQGGEKESLDDVANSISPKVDCIEKLETWDIAVEDQEERESREVQGGENEGLDDVANCLDAKVDCIENHETGDLVLEDQEERESREVQGGENESLDDVANRISPKVDFIENHETGDLVLGDQEERESRQVQRGENGSLDDVAKSISPKEDLVENHETGELVLEDQEVRESREVQGGENESFDEYAKSTSPKVDCIEKLETGELVSEDQEERESREVQGGEIKYVDDVANNLDAKEDCIENHETGELVLADQEERESREVQGGEIKDLDGVANNLDAKENCTENHETDVKIVSDISSKPDAEPDKPSSEPLDKQVEDPKLEDSEGEALKLEETLKPEEIADVALTEETQDPVENKHVVEIEKHKHENNKDMKLEEENEKLREMVAKLIEAGNEQLSVISSLSGRVKDLEMKLGKKKKPKMRRIRVGSHCTKPSDRSVKSVKGGVV